MKVAIAGASGYTGGELLRLLALHRKVEVTYVTSREYEGKPIHYAHPHLKGFYKGLRFSRLDLNSILKADVDAIFMALPHGVGLHITPKLLDSGLIVVDLSADYRLRDPEMYKVWYGFEHPYPDLLSKAVYGLPELHRSELKSARLIAVPGCNATASILASAPLVKHKIVDPSLIVVDVKAGSSEAGAKPTRSSHHPAREGSTRPYSARGHRHQAEVEQELSIISGIEVKVTMISHAVSSVRGALASSHGRLVTDDIDENTVWKAYLDMYSNEKFIRLLHPSAPPATVDVKFVVGSNFVDITFAIDYRSRRISGFAALDNLVKGAAGQAIQAFNISIGIDESEGLNIPPLFPA